MKLVLWNFPDQKWVTFDHVIDFFDALKTGEYARQKKDGMLKEDIAQIDTKIKKGKK